MQNGPPNKRSILGFIKNLFHKVEAYFCVFTNAQKDLASMLYDVATYDKDIEIARIVLNKLPISQLTITRNLNKSTPLHVAAMNNHTELMQLLIDAGANKEAVDSMGNTPLFYAVTCGKLEAVQCLLKNNANQDAVNARGQFLLTCAIMFRKATIVEHLLKHRQNFPKEIINQALYYVRTFYDKAILDLLLDNMDIHT